MEEHYNLRQEDESEEESEQWETEKQEDEDESETAEWEEEKQDT
jgi:hypothetical protein